MPPTPPPTAPQPRPEVLVVGAGPTGLAVACELALAGVRCRVLERRGGESNTTRAFGLHARALELLDARGLGDELVARGAPIRRPRTSWSGSHRPDFGELDTRYPMLLIVPQSGTEHVLHERALELGVEIVRGAEVVSLRQAASTVHVGLSDQDAHQADYLVAADGAHSTVRELLGVGFDGETYSSPMLLADVRLACGDDAPMSQAGPGGVVVAIPFGDGWFRVGCWSPKGDMAGFDELRATFAEVAGTDYGMSEPRWFSRFVSRRRQASDYRVGRVFLAGDAAHVNSPMGGQGMNTGVQDAFNLGWKLAAAVHGHAPDWLLDTYHAERHPVGAEVLALTDSFTKGVVSTSRLRLAAYRHLMGAMLRVGPVRRKALRRISGLGVAYPPRRPGAHRLTGTRAADRETRDGRLYELMRDGRFVLLLPENVTASPGVARPDGYAAWSDRLRVAATPEPAAVLVRPDGYVAWSDDRPTPESVRAAVMEWCGPAEHRRPQERACHRPTGNAATSSPTPPSESSPATAAPG